MNLDADILHMFALKNLHLKSDKLLLEYDSVSVYKYLCCLHFVSLSVVCLHFNALKLQLESLAHAALLTLAMLPVLAHLPKPSYSFLHGNKIHPEHFLSNAQKYNGCFHTSLFGADIFSYIFLIEFWDLHYSVIFF